MSILERFFAYAEAFEKSYVDDDWSHIAPFFTEDATYEGGPEIARGRDAVLGALQASVNSLDRLMDRRVPELDPPTVEGNTLSMTWRMTYSKAGCPDLLISGDETAVFRGDQIAELRDAFSAEAQQNIERWMADHGPQQ